MAMATQCPACETVFRVTPQQLQACQGQVRCGRCMTVFDGFRGLTTLPDSPAADAPPPAAPAADAAAAFHAAETPQPDAAPAAGETAAAPGAEGDAAAMADPAFADFGLEPVTEAPAPAGAPPGEGETPYPAMVRRATVAAGPVTDFEEDDVYPEAPRRIWPWAAGTALVALALAGQAAYYYRSELAVRYPMLKPALVELCQLAGCSVPLPQRPKLINIEASDLQAVDPARPGMIQLTATLRNHAGHDVGYPALDVVLTNTREHTLARRIFLPAEYLGPGRDPRAGIPAKGEVTVRIDLDTGDLGAAGFRLELLPAPPQ